MNAPIESPGPVANGSGDCAGAVVRAKFRPSRALMAAARAKAKMPSPQPRRTNAERLARQLALAHWIDRAVEEGQVASYGEVARALGLTESRITQVTALLGLSPALQERILLGEGRLRIRAAIRAAREAEWERQRSLSPSAHVPQAQPSCGPETVRLLSITRCPSQNQE